MQDLIIHNDYEMNYLETRVLINKIFISFQQGWVLSKVRPLQISSQLMIFSVLGFREEAKNRGILKLIYISETHMNALTTKLPVLIRSRFTFLEGS